MQTFSAQLAFLYLFLAITSLIRLFHAQLTSLFVRRNYAEFIPAIRWLDFQGIESEFKDVEDQLRKSIIALIEYKRREMHTWLPEDIQSGTNEKDIMSKLLSMDGDDRFSEEQLVSVVFVRALTFHILHNMHEHIPNPRDTLA